MPTPLPTEPRTGLTRREALVSALAIGCLTAGCTTRTRDEHPAGNPVREQPPELDPDVALAAAALAQEQGLLDVVNATIRRHTDLRQLVASTLTTHQEHVRILTEAVPASSPAPPSPPEVPAVRVPDNATKAVRALSRREEQQSLSSKRSAFIAQSGAFARLLAGMAAAAAQQAVVLGQYAPTEPINR